MVLVVSTVYFWAAFTLSVMGTSLVGVSAPILFWIVSAYSASFLAACFGRYLGRDGAMGWALGMSLNALIVIFSVALGAVLVGGPSFGIVEAFSALNWLLHETLWPVLWAVLVGLIHIMFSIMREVATKPIDIA